MTTLDNIVEEIKKAESIVILTHETPDGDAIGSSLAMYNALKQIGKKVEIINIGEHVAKEAKAILKNNDQMAEHKEQSIDTYLTETECKFNEVASKLLGTEVKAKQVKEEIEFLS